MKVAIEDTTTVNKASGDIVSFEATSVQPLQSLTVHVEPVQDLHGYDSPWPAGGGKNLLFAGAVNETRNGLTFTAIGDGSSFRVSGTAYSNTGYTILSGAKAPEKLKSGVTYTLSGGHWANTDVAYVQLVYKGDTTGNTISIASANAATTITPSEDATLTGIYINFKSGNTFTDDLVQPQFEVGSSASAFAPYSNICPISGWNSVDVWAAGANLLNDAFSSSYTNEIVLTEGTYYAQAWLTETPSQHTTDIQILIDGVWKGCAPPYSGDGITVTGTKFGWLGNDAMQTIIVSAGKTYTIRYACNDAAMQTRRLTFSKTQLPAFSPYAGQSITIPLGTTVYGGTLDAVNGTMTITQVKAQHSFALPTRQENGRWVLGFYPEDILSTLFGKQWAVSEPPLKNLFRASNLPIIKEGNLTSADSASVSFYGHNNGVEIRPRFLASQFSAEEAQAIASATEFVYPINPIEITLTPTQVKTLLGTNNIWADAGEIDVEWRGTWKDITGWIAWQGLDFSRNDIDASDAGRDINGKMQRGRIAIKEKMTVRTVQLDQNDIATVHALCEPSQFNVRVNPYPRTNGEKVMTMYTNNVKTDYVIHRENGNDLQELSFPLIEI